LKNVALSLEFIVYRCMKRIELLHSLAYLTCYTSKKNVINPWTKEQDIFILSFCALNNVLDDRLQFNFYSRARFLNLINNNNKKRELDKRIFPIRTPKQFRERFCIIAKAHHNYYNDTCNHRNCGVYNK
jgi:hypothetical protein